ncbi:hypothetical protein PFISCL1PPCAC_22274, partial [Pristionchus fissidentatus]
LSLSSYPLDHSSPPDFLILPPYPPPSTRSSCSHSSDFPIASLLYLSWYPLRYPFRLAISTSAPWATPSSSPSPLPS